MVNELIILGEPSNKFKDQIIKIISTKAKGSFIENNINNDIKTVKDLYSSLGYNFAKVETKIRKIDVDNLDLIFDINRGEVTKISKISFTGDKKVRDKRLRDVIASEEDKFWKIISKNTKVIIVEGNYILLNSYPWSELNKFFNTTIMINCEKKILEKRLIERWENFNLPKEEIDEKVYKNDLPNGVNVLKNSIKADYILEN